MSEQPRGAWVSDGPDFEYMEAGPFVLEVARRRHGGYRWSAALTFGGVEQGFAYGESDSRPGARLQAVAASHGWLSDARAALPSMEAVAASLRAPTPPCCESCGDQDDGCEECNGAA